MTRSQGEEKPVWEEGETGISGRGEQHVREEDFERRLERGQSGQGIVREQAWHTMWLKTREGCSSGPCLRVWSLF